MFFPMLYALCLLLLDFPLTLYRWVCYETSLTLVTVSKRLADVPEEFMALVVEFYGEICPLPHMN